MSSTHPRAPGREVRPAYQPHPNREDQVRGESIAVTLWTESAGGLVHADAVQIATSD